MRKAIAMAAMAVTLFTVSQAKAELIKSVQQVGPDVVANGRGGR